MSTNWQVPQYWQNLYPWHLNLLSHYNHCVVFDQNFITTFVSQLLPKPQPTVSFQHKFNGVCHPSPKGLIRHFEQFFTSLAMEVKKKISMFFAELSYRKFTPILNEFMRLKNSCYCGSRRFVTEKLGMHPGID